MCPVQDFPLRKSKSFEKKYLSPGSAENPPETTSEQGRKLSPNSFVTISKMPKHSANTDEINPEIHTGTAANFRTCFF